MALGVVLFVLISIVALVLINISGQKGSESRVLANNLAREGIEAVRNLRDTARLQKTDVSLPGFSSTNHFFYPVINTSNSKWTLQNVPNFFSETETRLRLKDNVYQHNLSNTYTYTIFQRQLTMDPICVDTSACVDGIDDPVVSLECSSCPDANSDSLPDISGYRVTSEVRWLENNQTVSIKLLDFLYDWR